MDIYTTILSRYLDVLVSIISLLHAPSKYADFSTYNSAMLDGEFWQLKFVHIFTKIRNFSLKKLPGNR